MNTHKPIPGDSIYDAISSALEKATKDDPCTITNFNGVDVIVNFDDAISEVVDRYHKLLEANAKAWRESPEGKAAETRRVQAQIDALNDARAAREKFKSINATDRTAVIRWIAEHGDATDNTGVRSLSMETLSDLESAGYVANAFSGSEFDPNDEVKIEKYLIGQAISCLRDVGAIHRILVMWCKDYLQGLPMGKRQKP